MPEERTYTDIDLTSDILMIAKPLVNNPDDVNVYRMDKEEERTNREQFYVVVCNKEDIGKLIGRHGVISDSIRTLLNVSIKNMHKKVHLKFMTTEDYQTFNK